MEASGYMTPPGRSKRFGISKEAEVVKRKRDGRRNEYENNPEV